MRRRYPDPDRGVLTVLTALYSVAIPLSVLPRIVAGRSAFDAAISAGRTRIRPVLITAAATIVGMIPMTIGGAGEEQNAALAPAVIGGLLFATPTTLLVVYPYPL
jgi:multidrug efflux pump subunit AcrB